MEKHYFAKVGVLLACLGLIPVSCEKSPEMAVSSKEVIFDAYPEDQTIEISTTVAWTAEVRQTGEWLTVDPTEGKGSATITLTASENTEFTGRNALVIIVGDGMQADTIKVIQTAGIDVANEIVDEIFWHYCMENFDNSPQDGKLSLRETKDVAKIDVKKMGITSLAGIEYFSRLKNLDCSFNLLESIDVSGNKELTDLNCSCNALESIDVSQNTGLLRLDCSYNPISKINIEENVKLIELSLFYMGLTEIDVSQNTSLRYLEISNNRMTALDISNNRELNYLGCNETGLTKLDIGNNVKLRSLYCVNNKITVLNTNNNSLLGVLWCNSNPYISLNLSQNPELEELSCARDSLKVLDISKNVKLRRLYCETNQLAKLDVAANTELTELRCNANKLAPSIDLSKNIKLQRFNFQSNPLLYTIEVWHDFLPNSDYHQIDSPPTQYVWK